MNRKLHPKQQYIVRELYQEGFSSLELALMYNISEFRIKQCTKGLRKPDRI